MTERARGAIWMLVSAAAFAAMGAFVKAATATPFLEKVIVRNLFTLAIAGLLAVARRRPLLGRLRNQPVLFTRSLLGLGGVTCYFYAVDHLLLADATMLTKLSPFFVAIFASVFLGERPTRSVVLGMAAAFFGGLLVIKPRFDVGVVPALVGLGSAAFAGGAYTVLRALRAREAPETIIFHFSLVTFAALLPVAAPGLVVPTGREMLWLAGIGAGAALGQFGLTIAYRHAPAAEVSIYSYAMILVAAALGFAFWSEVPDLLSAAGGVLIIFGGAAAYLGDRRRDGGDASASLEKYT
jgi:drug/metabolite transporter (DMT)-like permease